MTYMTLEFSSDEETGIQLSQHAKRGAFGHQFALKQTIEHWIWTLNMTNMGGLGNETGHRTQGTAVAKLLTSLDNRQ